MCVADIEGKGFRADASDVAAGINTGFFVRFGKLGIDIDNITLVGNGMATAATMSLFTTRAQTLTAICPRGT